MKYILKNDVALRSWTDYPYSYTVLDGVGSWPEQVSHEEFEFLCRCDGKTEITEKDDAMIRHFTIYGLIRPANDGETTEPWQNRSFDTPFHHTLSWGITSRCNLNCIHCFNAADNRRRTDEFSFAEVCALLDEAERVGIRGVRLTGGEPMIRPDFMDIVREIYRRHMELYQIETNCSFITEEKLKVLKEYNPHIEFRTSFDGLGTHDWMRRQPGSEEKALRAIAMVIAQGFPVLVHINVNKVTQDVVYNTILHLADMGVSAVRLLRTTEAPRWEENGQDFILSFEEYFEVCLSCAKQYKDSGRKANLLMWQFGKLIPTRKRFTVSACKGRSTDYNPDCVQCEFARTGAPYVAADGNMYPCHGAEGWCIARGLSMGNVQKEPLPDLLKHRYKEYMTLGEAMSENKECSSCPYMKICRGGCPALAILLSGSNTAPDPSKCLMLRQGFYERYCEAMQGWQNGTPRDEWL